MSLETDANVLPHPPVNSGDSAFHSASGAGTASASDNGAGQHLRQVLVSGELANTGLARAVTAELAYLESQRAAVAGQVAGMTRAELFSRKSLLCGMAGTTEEGRLELLTIQAVLNGGVA